MTENEAVTIPYTTRRNWNQLVLAQTIGYDPADPFLDKIDFHKKFIQVSSLVKIAKCLWLICSTYFLLMEKVKAKKRIIRENLSALCSCIARISPALGLRRSCRIMGISLQRYYRNKITSCRFASSGICKKLVPQQITGKEKNSIEKYLNNDRLQGWSLFARYYLMMWEGTSFMSLQTFYKHCKSFINPNMITRKEKRKKGIRARHPFELLHMDCTLLRLQDNTRVYIQFVTDNFSRHILAFKASLNWNSSYTVENLKSACDTYNLYGKPLLVMCDNGSENKGKVDAFLLQPHTNFRKIIAQADVVFSNSMAEAVNKKMKYDFLFRNSLASLQDVINCLNKSVHRYNNRFHSALHGYTPAQVLAGYIPKPGLFKTEIEQARKNRIIQNKKDLCGLC